MAAAPPGYAKAVGLRALAAFLILWAPFFDFAADRGYPLPPLAMAYSAAICAVIALALSALCGRAGGIRQAIVFTLLVALALDIMVGGFRGGLAYAISAVILAVFWLLRQRLPAILSAAFGALLASSAVLSALQPYSDVQTAEFGPAQASGDPRPQRVIHLILDEFAGLQGIPRDLPGGTALRDELREFFVANGFRVFGNAISEYAASRDSISGILNFTAGTTPYERYSGRRPYVLTENAYFSAMEKAGFAIAVHQSTYLDYCSKAPGPIDICQTYQYDGTTWLREAPLSDLGKLNVLFGMYLQLSDVAESLLKSYARLQWRRQDTGTPLPPLPGWDAGPSSINGMRAFERFIEAAAAGPGGRLYFAHLLFPHGPHAFDPACRMRRDTWNWTNHRPPYRSDSTAAERALSYSFYFEQVRCTMRLLQTLLERLEAEGHLADATIIVHGDHGSRIYETAPRSRNLDALTPQDYRDGFATLFAVRSPLFEAGYDGEVVPVSRLLARAAGGPELVESPQSRVLVYLEGDDDDDPRMPVPWSFFE